MASVDYLRIRKAVQYTGSNGAEVAAFAGVPGVVSDNGTVLKIGYPDSGYVSYTLNIGDYFEDSENITWPHTDFNTRHITKEAALLTTNANNNAAIAALQASQNSQAGQITAATNTANAASTAVAGKLGKADIASISVPILLLGGTADRPITWTRPFTNTSYDLSYAYDASTLGRISCAPVGGTKTVNGITIRITASLLAVSVLGVVHVMGVGV